MSLNQKPVAVRPAPINEYFADVAGVGRGRGGRRPGAGRPPKDGEAPMVRYAQFCSAEQMAYLAKWAPEPAEAVRRILDRAVKMWPKGQ